MKLQPVGKSSFASAPMAADVSGLTVELDSALDSGDADISNDSLGGTRINRSLPATKPGPGKPVNSKPKSNPSLDTHFQGLNFHDQRFANGGERFGLGAVEKAAISSQSSRPIKAYVQAMATSSRP